MNKNWIIVLAVLFVIGVCGGLIEMTLFPNYTQDEISMIQPNGWIPPRDAYYAQKVNEPNSHANLNNSQAELADAQAAEYYAQATAIVANANAPAIQAQSLGTGLGCGITTVWLVAFLGVIVLLLRRKVR